MKIIGITGGTGFIGSHITQLLAQKGYNVVIFTRRIPKTPTQENVSYALWDPYNKKIDVTQLAGVDGVIHLAGESVAAKRLTAARKKEIVDSRVKTTQFLVDHLRQHAPKCKTFVAASAIGVYGPDRPGSAPFTETDPPSGDFLGDTCRQWEEAIANAGTFVNTAIIRIGIVLGKEAGAFPELAKPLSFGIMPILGNGRQVVSWIHVIDLARLFVFALENNIAGTLNGIAPAPITHSELMHTIANLKGGLAIPVPVPSILLKIIVGELATEVLKSARVSAAKTVGTGFTFLYPDAVSAVKSLIAH